MAKNVSYVTKEGLKKLQDELDRLQSVERPKISKAIGEAIEKGDISIKCGTNEGLDALGEGRAVKAVAVCLMERKE